MGDNVFVRVALYRYIMRFSKKDKLALRFMALLKILKYVAKVAY